jgi:hypothetical protein
VDLDYPGLLSEITEERAPGRTESHAFLLWFLKNYYRLDDIEAADSVCDGFDDKGIDAVYIDNNLETIDVFQSKLIKNSVRTLGDTQLREFVGALAQLRDPATVTQIAQTTSNTELSRLLQSENVATKIADGFTVRGIFLTNIQCDNNAVKYIGTQDNLRVFDKSELLRSYVPSGPTSPIGTPVAFDVFGYDCIKCSVGDATAIFAPLKASELVRLDGISSNELFAWNVRSSLGKTKVNKDITASIGNVDEHKEFLLFHNGLTLLCQGLEYADDKITISGYSVVNGCQSLTSLYENRTKITGDLRLICRIVKLPPGNMLAEKITHHSNNQNPINARDLQSNSSIQRRLQNEFRQNYDGDVFYRIKRGEGDQAPVNIDNDEAGRLLLAFDLKQPWTCHKSYAVLDELHGSIYARPEITAHRILVVHEIASEVISALPRIENRMLASYRLTRYFMVYLVRLALELDERGKEFIGNPATFLEQVDGRARIKAAIGPVISDLTIDLNAEIRERHDAGNPFDFKRELKNSGSVREISRSIVANYQKSVARGRADSFGVEWEKLPLVAAPTAETLDERPTGE